MDLDSFVDSVRSAQYFDSEHIQEEFGFSCAIHPLYIVSLFFL